MADPVTGNGRYDPTASVGVARVEGFVREQLGWIFRNQPEDDVGIDAHLEPSIEVARTSPSSPTGRLLGLQIKSGESYFTESTEDGWYYRISDEHYQYWTGHTLPVLIVLWDIENQTGFWVHVRPETIQSTRKGWKILVPRSQTLDSNVRDTGLEIAEVDSMHADQMVILNHTWPDSVESPALAAVDR